MSKTKKLRKAQERQKEIRKVPKNRSQSNKIFIILAAVVALAIIVVVCVEKFSRKTAVRIGEEKIYQDEMMYYVQQTEQQANMMDGLYQQFYGTSYWNYTNEDGKTGRDEAKASIEEDMIMDGILYQEAVKAGVSLSDEEKKTADEEAGQAFSAITSSTAAKYNLTKKKYESVCEKKAMAEAYKEQLIDGFDIDDEAIKEGVDYDTYRQYNVKYYFMPVADDTQDAAAADEDEKKDDQELEGKKEAARKSLQDLKDKINAGEEFESLEEVASKAGIVANVKNTAAVTKANSGFDEKISEEIYKMNNGDVSEVLEAENGYYLFKMIDNDTKEAYDAQVESEIKKAEDERFDKEYEEVLYPKYEVKINSSLWNHVTLGEVFKQ